MIDAARRPARLGSGALPLPSVLGLLLFFVAPAAVFAVYSFLTARLFGVSTPFTLDAYRKALTTPVNGTLSLNSLRIGAIVAFASVAVGLPIAYWLRYLAGRLQLPALFLIVASMLAGYLVRIYSWRTMLGRHGIVNEALRQTGLVHEPLSLLFNRFAVAIAEVHVFLPYVVLVLFAGLRPLEPEYLEAAQDLGANAFTRWRRVILPLLAAPIAATLLFVFVLAAADWFTPYYLGGTSGGLLGERIFVVFRQAGDYPQGAALALLTLAAFFVCDLLVVLALRAMRITRIRWGT